MRFQDLWPGPAPQLPLESFERRRARLAKALGPGKSLVVATHPTHTFSNDVEFTFRPHSDFWYLTGFNEPGALLVVEGGSGRSTLFLRDRKPEAEIWTGRRLGVERAPDALGVDDAHDIRDLSRLLPIVLRGARKVLGVTKHDPAVHRRVRRAAGKRYAEDGGPIHEMRLRKERDEVRLLQKACDLGIEAQLRAASRMVPGAREFQVEADVGHAFRHAGSTGPGYPSIAGCGPNGAVLHYIANRDPLRSGELLLLDSGCEWGYYTSDITRTYPVGGRFSPLQARLYDLVLDAHQAAMRKVRPGARFREPHEAAVEVLVDGLLAMKYLEGRREKILKDQSYRSFFMHGTSHFLGLDVHDVGHVRGQGGKGRVLEEGMVLTVEPGLYFNPDYAPCPPEATGIGIRIEDDVLVTASGHRNLTRRLPVERGEVAALVRKKG